MHEEATYDGFVEQVAEGHPVRRELEAVAPDPLSLVAAGRPAVGLVVDDDQAGRRAHEQVDVALEHGAADVDDDEQLPPVLGASGRGAHDRCVERRVRQRGDERFEPEDPLRRALHGGQAVDVAAARQVGILEHGVHRPTDGRAVAAALPRRQVQVDGVLAQPGIAHVDVGAVAVQANRGTGRRAGR